MSPTPEMIEAVAAKFRPMFSEEMAEGLATEVLTAALALLPGGPVAHIVTQPNGKQRVTLATQYDPMASSFWVGGEMPKGYSVTPLYASPAPLPVAVKAQLDETVDWIGTVACPCTTFEQDETCPVGQPSLLCGACGGKGVVKAETVMALAAEMLKVAEQVDELEDPFAAWESIELLKSASSPTPTPASDIAALREENGILSEALKRMENCYEQLAATRTHEIYTAMIDGGQADALLDLDNARRNARTALSQQGESKG
ncbi:hypothetical protein PH552_12100 [Rhizobium sp. CNPSo 3968]|uniref:hypothetical protein n=1 Tax=Rhizobium sp. CNPSo 3968 TaxID=3021408 RepID=UPI00254EC85A|nr:hypothetical protein [Rhizobium sp. CNPSo 3968]MDK4720086.1 hypothetical protein [Rhizobium sp. CNPSo 3968]